MMMAAVETEGNGKEVERSCESPQSKPHGLPEGFILAACAPEDNAAMVDVYISAFASGNFTYWWPAVDLMREWSERRFMNRFKDPRSVQFIAVLNTEHDHDNDDGSRVAIDSRQSKKESVVAYAKWTLPKPTGGAIDLDSHERLRRALGLDDQIQSRDSTDVPRVQMVPVSDGLEQGENPNIPSTTTSHGDHPRTLPHGVDVPLYEEFFNGIDRAEKKWGADNMLGWPSCFFAIPCWLSM